MRFYKRAIVAAALAGVTAAGGLALPAQAIAQQSAPAARPDPAEQERIFKTLKWREGAQPVTERANIRLPAGVRYLDPADTDTLLKLTGNLPEGNSYTVAAQDMSWFAVFEFDDMGYVKDDEKIDADALLKSMQEAQEASNNERLKQGLNALTLTGWAVPPHYDPTTHNLEYGLSLASLKGDNVNYTARILGRRGVMTATLISDSEHLQTNLAAFRKTLAGFAYVPDESYAAYKDGDKVSEYGLAALVAGGAAAAALKGGLLKGLLVGLAAFWKLIAVGVVGAFAALRRLFKGKRDELEG